MWRGACLWGDAMKLSVRAATAAILVLPSAPAFAAEMAAELAALPLPGASLAFAGGLLSLLWLMRDRDA